MSIDLTDVGVLHDGFFREPAPIFQGIHGPTRPLFRWPDRRLWPLLSTAPPSAGSEVAQALAAMAAESAAVRSQGGGTVADTLAEWLSTRNVLAARQLADEAGEDGSDLKTLASLTADIVSLRKGDQGAERLRIERERLEIERERSEARMQLRFEEWLKQPGMADRICGPKLTPEQKEARMRRIFGLGTRATRVLSPDAITENRASPPHPLIHNPRSPILSDPTESDP